MFTDIDFRQLIKPKLKEELVKDPNYKYLMDLFISPDNNISGFKSIYREYEFILRHWLDDFDMNSPIPDMAKHIVSMMTSWAAVCLALNKWKKEGAEFTTADGTVYKIDEVQTYLSAANKIKIVFNYNIPNTYNTGIKRIHCGFDHVSRAEDEHPLDRTLNFSGVANIQTVKSTCVLRQLNKKVFEDLLQVVVA